MAKNNPAKRQKSDSSALSVFVYTGAGCAVPGNVVCVQFDPAFYNCTQLREVVFNEGLQKIGDRAFCNCILLESITLPSTITKVGAQAFRNCSKLREVILHEGMGNLGANVFEDCPSVKVFRFPLLSERIVLIANNWADLNNKVNEVRGVVQWEDGDLFVPPAAMEDGNNWNWGSNIRDILCKIERLVSHYEMKEVTTIIELALWKVKLDQAGSNTANRSEYRIEVPGPVKETILEYFYS